MLCGKYSFIYAKHFALTFLRGNPFIRKLCLLENRFPLLFAQSIYLSKLVFCAKIQPFPPLRENAHGAFYRSRLAKVRFCRALFTITASRAKKKAVTFYILLLQGLIRSGASHAPARKSTVLLHFIFTI